jgi:hypothetical protein
LALFRLGVALRLALPVVSGQAVGLLSRRRFFGFVSSRLRRRCHGGRGRAAKRVTHHAPIIISLLGRGLWNRRVGPHGATLCIRGHKDRQILLPDLRSAT